MNRAGRVDCNEFPKYFKSVPGLHKQQHLDSPPTTQPRQPPHPIPSSCQPAEVEDSVSSPRVPSIPLHSHQVLSMSFISTAQRQVGHAPGSTCGPSGSGWDTRVSGKEGGEEAGGVGGEWAEVDGASSHFLAERRLSLAEQRRISLSSWSEEIFLLRTK